MNNKKNLSLTIGWLYPELMNTYGDRGNIIVLEKRCQWRRISVNIRKLDIGHKVQELKTCDLLFMGGAQDRQQKIVATDLKQKAKTLKEMINAGIPGLFICGAYQFLGKYYKDANGTIIPGLGILDLYTENPGEKIKRLIGNAIIKVPALSEEGVLSGTPLRCAKRCANLVGFENHGGRTYLGKGAKPLGEVISGFGNNGDLPASPDGRHWQAGDKTEGAIYKNTFGTYLHGPLLPKNPHLADYFIKLALEKKYKKIIELIPLDDKLEHQAREVIVQRLGIKI